MTKLEKKRALVRYAGATLLQQSVASLTERRRTTGDPSYSFTSIRYKCRVCFGTGGAWACGDGVVRCDACMGRK